VCKSPFRKEWALSICDQCEKAKVPFFFKPWEGVRKRKAGRDLEGKKYDRVPRRLELPVLDNTRRLAAAWFKSGQARVTLCGAK